MSKVPGAFASKHLWRHACIHSRKMATVGAAEGTAGRAPALHAADLGLILDTPSVPESCGEWPPSTEPGVNPDGSLVRAPTPT